MKAIRTHSHLISRGKIFFAFLAWLFSGPLSAAQNTLNNVSVAEGQNQSQVIKIVLKDALDIMPVSFTTSNPHRLVLDFPNAANSLGRVQETLNIGAIKNYQIVQSGDRTRVVFNLTGPASHELRKDKNVVLAVLQFADRQAATDVPVASARFPEVGKQRDHSIGDLDFRRGKNGEGRILVSLSDPGVGIDIQHKGRAIQIDFLNTSLPSPLQRRLDVSEFATPMQMVETFEQGKNTRMLVTPKGKWDYSAYQTGNHFTIEVRPFDEKQDDKSSRPVYSGEKLSLNFQNVDVRGVLQVIADFTSLNIIASDTVTGNITLRLKDVPWDQALDIIMRAKGLDKRSSGNVIWVAPREELAAKEKVELEAKQAIAQLEELQTEIISLNYLRADEAQKIILGLSLSGTPAGEKVSCSTDIGELKVDTSTRKSGVSTSGDSTSQGGSVNAVSNNSLISIRGSVTYDLKTNSIFLKETPTQIEKVKVLLNKVDVPARQIMIEARVVLAGDSWGRALGARLGLSHKSTQIAFGDTISRTSGALLGSPLPVNPQVNLNAPSVLGSATTAPSLGISVLNAAANTMLSLELEALEADKRGKVVSSPRVITQNQQPAVILQGQKVPNLKINSTTGGQTIEIEYKDAFLCLLVDPQVLNNDEIIMNVSVNKDTTSNPIDLPNGSRLIPIDTKRVRTTVRVKNGETAVLGGVYEQELLNNTEKVPFLGDIPIFGNLFRSNIKEDKKAELLIFLTPRLLDDVILDAR